MKEDNDNGFEIIPDSLELEIAYWETFRSGWPMERFRQGEPIGHIARSHNRSTRSLVVFFTRKYGDDWRKNSPSHYAAAYLDTNNKGIRNEQIVSLLAEGWRLVEISKVLGAPVSTISKRIATHNLREVANAKQTVAA